MASTALRRRLRAVAVVVLGVLAALPPAALALSLLGVLGGAGTPTLDSATPDSATPDPVSAASPRANSPGPPRPSGEARSSTRPSSQRAPTSAPQSGGRGPGPGAARTTAPGSSPTARVSQGADAPRPAPPTEEAGRRSAGAQLAFAPNLQVTYPASVDLVEGRVDPRLLRVLADVSADSELAVAAFRLLGNQQGGSALRRSMLVTAVDGAPVPGDPAAVAALRRRLRAEPATFRPRVRSASTAAGSPALEVFFSNP